MVQLHGQVQRLQKHLRFTNVFFHTEIKERTHSDGEKQELQLLRAPADSSSWVTGLQHSGKMRVQY